MDVPNWMTTVDRVPVVQVPLSERDGDVFDLAFLRPATFFAPMLEIDTQQQQRATAEKLEPVQGAVLFQNVLTVQECKDICIAAESAGFYQSKGIGPATKSGKPCPPKVVLVLQPEHAEAVFERIKHGLEEQIEIEGEMWSLAGINPRLRIHKYCAGYTLGPHFDRGKYRASAVDEFGELRFDYYGDDRSSKMSLLIYLTGEEECSQGGQTTFFPDAKNEDGFVSSRAIKVDPQRGAAVAFFHGDHNLSPLHEGTELVEGFKYIIRTDVMYVRKE
jgi:hypothetical protein